jgi:hypothetical protein
MARDSSESFGDFVGNGKRTQKLLSRIYAMLEPLVKNEIKDSILKDFTSQCPELTDEEKQHLATISENGLSEEAKEFLDALKRDELSVKQLTKQEIDESIKEIALEELKMLVNYWIEMFLDIQQSCDGWRYIRVRTISDAMLPPLSKESEKIFQDQCMLTDYLDTYQVLSILRKLRASLPSGKVLPDEMVELLAFWRIKIV